jgi:predicted PurR-regulated permease PerM
MAFSFDSFYQLNRRVLIWAILIAVLWLLRDFSGLIFITFLLVFIATPLVRIGHQRLKIPYRLSLALVYLLFLLVLGGFVRYVTPSVIGEANRFVANFGDIKTRLVEFERNLSEEYPGLERSLHGYLRSLLDDEDLASINAELDQLRFDIGLEPQNFIDNADEHGSTLEHAQKVEQYQRREAELLFNVLVAEQTDNAREYLPAVINHFYKGTGTMLLALLFSFLILFDSERLRSQVKSLNLSRLRDFYSETAKPVVRFGYVVGRAIQAQAMIACVNTVLTLIGLLILGIPSLALLSLVVFVCSFVPVLGVIMSTIPITLVALNTGGPNLALGAIVMVVVIHAVEAYVLNPLIYGKHLKLNPVLVLIILLVGYHSFGLWGMLLGVPVAHYFIHDVFGVPLWDEKRLKRQRISAVPEVGPAETSAAEFASRNDPSG